VDCPTTPPFASILLFLHSVAIYNTTADSRGKGGRGGRGGWERGGRER
jgi:hypothetical protein